MQINIVDAIVSIMTAIIGIAILTVLVSNKSKTVEVINEASKSFQQILKITVDPINTGI